MSLGDIEGQDDHGINPGLGEEFKSLFGIGEQAGSTLGSNDRRWMTVEGDHRRTNPASPSFIADVLDHRLMTDMETVIGPDGDHG